MAAAAPVAISAGINAASSIVGALLAGRTENATGLHPVPALESS